MEHICQQKYNFVVNNQNKSYIRSILTLNNMSVAKLAELMSTALNKQYTKSGLYGKFDRDTLTLKECQTIAKILGYHIEFIKD